MPTNLLRLLLVPQVLPVLVVVMCLGPFHFS
jgi:hypothetical protein